MYGDWSEELGSGSKFSDLRSPQNWVTFDLLCPLKLNAKSLYILFPSRVGIFHVYMSYEV